MTALTLSLGASSATTKTSSSNSGLSVDHRRITRTDLGNKVVMVEVHPRRSPSLNDEESLDDLIAEFSQDRVFADAFKNANVDIANRYYADEGLTIRTLRLKAGLSQAQLADAISTVQSHISRIEAGSQDVYTDTVDRLARAFGATSAEVLDAVRNTRSLAEQKA